VKFSVITPNYNGARFLERALHSVQQQLGSGIEVEHIVMDAMSTDESEQILSQHAETAHVVREKDTGPANAINKGLGLATGDILAWLNADDVYEPDAFERVAAVFAENPRSAFCFGRCKIIDEGGEEIRKGITRFKEAFFPLSSRFTLQSINYISQPAMFFRRSAFEQAGFLREDFKAAWDYEFILRLWHQGRAVCVPGPPLANFRWHAGSISGTHFRQQFKEEFEVARADAGRFAPQTLLHAGVRWGIVGIYSLMATRRVKSRA